MLNIFIAVGGSGSKVAEALVRMLAIGFPTRRDESGLFTSYGDELQIWRLDPDRSAGAAHSLQQALDEYAEMQQCLKKEGSDSSAWAMEIDPKLRHLDPLNLGEGQPANQNRTLGSILDSQERGRQDTSPFLDLFYEPKDLAVAVDRGFYQKPFIGAPIMALFAKSLREISPAAKLCNFTGLEERQVRFFLCGSLHGGTGACGVPVMAQFLGELKKAKPQLPWQVGGCLLAPYFSPPRPPFPKLDDQSAYSAAMAQQRAQSFSNVAPFSQLATEEEKTQLAAQILQGFYADPDDLTERARQSLVYYKAHLTEYFNALYLIGKPAPDTLELWSNGGASQQNPTNSAEVVGALAALEFFSGAHDRAHQSHSYLIGSSTRTLGERMALRDLPLYRMPGKEKFYTVNPERVFLTAALQRHLILHQLPWGTAAKFWPQEFALKNYYFAHPQAETEDEEAYRRALEVLTKSIRMLLAPDLSLGWDGKDFADLDLFLTDSQENIASATGRLKKRYSLFRNDEQGVFSLGQSSLKLTDKEFGALAPIGTEFSRGDYLRFVWSKLLRSRRSETQA